MVFVNLRQCVIISGLLCFLMFVMLSFSAPQSLLGSEFAVSFLPVLAFERVHSVEETILLFGLSQSSEESLVSLRKMDLVNQLDYIFMLSYGAYLVSVNRWVLSKQKGSVWCSRLIYALPVLAVLADFFENIVLLSLSNYLQAYLTKQTQEVLSSKAFNTLYLIPVSFLPIGVGIKFFALTAHFVCIAQLLTGVTKKRFVFIRSLAWVGFAAMLLSFFYPLFFTDLFTLCLSIGWVTLLIFIVRSPSVNLAKKSYKLPSRDKNSATFL